jgi:hypothetical protein
MYMRGDRSQSYTDKITGLILFIGMFGYPFFCWYVINRFRERLEEPKIKFRISNLYQDVRLKHKSTEHLIYYPMFLFRRIMFVAIPTFLFKHPYYQV